jgi:hypothetical protein
VPLDPAALELLRASSGLSIDDEGRFLHRGEPITHPRTLEVLWRSLERVPDGRWLVRIGRESAYVDAGETPWRVRGLAERDGAPPLLLLAGGAQEPLDPSTVTLGRDGVVRCRLASGDHARFTRAGQLALAPYLDEDPPGTGHFHVTVGGARWKLGPQSRG